MIPVMYGVHAVAGLTALAALFAAPLTAAAQPAEATEAAALVARGEQLAQDARYDEALAAFKAAASQAPTAEHHCYVAYTYFRMRRLPEAWLHFDRAHSLGDGTAAGWCTTTLAADLQRDLRAGSFAPVTITTEPAGARVEVSSLAPGETVVAPRELWLAFGTHELVATRDGFRPERIEISVRSTAPMPVQIALVPTQGEARDDAATPPPVDVGAPPTTPQRDRTRTRPVWGWVALSAGVATAAAGGYFHARALATKRDAEELFPGPQFDAELDDFRRDRALALGGYALGAVATGVGLYMLLRNDEDADDERLAGVAVAPDSFALWLRWRM